MRDLYDRLDVPQSAREGELREAIARASNARLKLEASEILLNTSRREQYDRLHATLKRIGVMRSGLGLTHSAQWGSSLASDFGLPASIPSRRYTDFSAKLLFANDLIAGRSKARKGSWYRSWFIWVVIACGFTWMFFAEQSGNRKPPASLDTTELRSAQGEAAFNGTPKPLPATGLLQQYTAGSGVAPLTIRTAGDANYFVKLVDARSGSTAAMIFVRAGSIAKVEVPLGSYRLRYAAGNTWYGPEELFGPGNMTMTSEADKTFNFSRVGNQISGYTVTLYSVAGGNLQTSAIPRSKF